MVYARYNEADNYTFHGGYKPTYNWGPHPVTHQKKTWKPRRYWFQDRGEITITSLTNALGLSSPAWTVSRANTSTSHTYPFPRYKTHLAETMVDTRDEKTDWDPFMLCWIRGMGLNWKVDANTRSFQLAGAKSMVKSCQPLIKATWKIFQHPQWLARRGQHRSPGLNLDMPCLFCLQNFKRSSFAPSKK